MLSYRGGRRIGDRTSPLSPATSFTRRYWPLDGCLVRSMKLSLLRFLLDAVMRALPDLTLPDDFGSLCRPANLARLPCCCRIMMPLGRRGSACHHVVASIASPARLHGQRVGPLLSLVRFITMVFVAACIFVVSFVYPRCLSMRSVVDSA